MDNDFGPDGPSEDQMLDFIVENRQWLTEEAEEVLRSMSKADQGFVLAEGSMSNCRDPVAIIKTRACQGVLKADQKWVADRKNMEIGQLLEDFMAANAKWLNEEAEEVLRGMPQDIQRAVMDVGSIRGCRDPVAIVKSRAKQARARGLGQPAWKGFGKGKDIITFSKGGCIDIGKGKGKDMGKGKGKGWAPSNPWEMMSAMMSGQWSPYGPAEAYGPPGQSGQLGMGPPGQVEVKEEKKPKKPEHVTKEQFAKRMEEVKMENQQAVDEGRSMYCVGIPPMWTARQLEEFFNNQGKVKWVHMMPVKSQAESRAGFVNFETADGATLAAEVCDGLEIEDRGEKYTLTCSIKQRFGEKTFGKKCSQFATGMVHQIRAREEMRVVFISRVPLEVTADQLEALVKTCGKCEDVHMLTSNGMSNAYFVTMSKTDEAAYLIQSLNGAMAFGGQILASYAKEREDKKRKRPCPEDEGDYHILDVKNFPHWTTTEDLKAIIEETEQEVVRVRILTHDAQGKASLAKAYFSSPQAMEIVRRALDGFEFTPGFALQASARPFGAAGAAATPAAAAASTDAGSNWVGAIVPGGWQQGQQQQSGAWGGGKGAWNQSGGKGAWNQDGGKGAWGGGAGWGGGWNQAGAMMW